MVDNILIQIDLDLFQSNSFWHEHANIGVMVTPSCQCFWWDHAITPMFWRGHAIIAMFWRDHGKTLAWQRYPSKNIGVMAWPCQKHRRDGVITRILVCSCQKLFYWNRSKSIWNRLLSTMLQKSHLYNPMKAQCLQESLLYSLGRYHNISQPTMEPTAPS